MPDPKFKITAVDETRAAFVSAIGGFDKLRAAASNFSGTFSRLVGPITAAVGAIGAATAGISVSVSRALDTGDQLFKLSQKVGISVENLSELRFAAELSGVSLETLQKGLKDLSLVLVQANDASSKEAQLLKQLGVTAKEPELALRQVADAFAKLPDGATKTAVAVELFKKAGQDLIPLLNGGSAALDAAGFSARRLGLAFTTDAARAAEQFNDNMLKLRTGAEALGISLTSKLVSSMAQFTGDLVKGKEEGFKFKGVLDGILGTALELASTLPLVGSLANRVADVNALRVAEQQASIARRTSSGKIGGRAEEQVDPDAQAKLTCTLSGGTWDARARRCIPKPTNTGTKPLTFDELLARNAAKRVAVFEELDATEGRAAEEERRKSLEEDARTALERMKLRDEAIEKADAEYKANQSLAQSYIDLADPAAQYVRQLDEIRKLVGEGFLTQEQGLAAEFAIQGLIDRALGLGEAAKDAGNAAKEMGLAFASAASDAIRDWKGFGSLLRSVAVDIGQILFKRSVTDPLGRAAGSVLEKTLAKLFNFADGGSFMVGGSGGTDSQLVAFKASPNERVTIETPDQQRSGRGGGNTFHFSIDARGADPGVADRISAAVREAVALSLQAVQAQADRGGAFARAVGRR